MNYWQYIKTIGSGMICAIGGIELLLHAFPVKSSHQFMPTDRDSPVRQAQAATLVEPIDWKFSRSVERRINNYGFVDDTDYAPGEESIAVIGDSFIQSAMLPYAATLQGNLQRQLGNKTRVYSYGIPGYSMAGYIGSAEYASKIFKPQAFVFLVTKGDITDSFDSWGGSYYLNDDLQLQFKDGNTSKMQQFLSQSRLFNYTQKQLYLSSHNFSPIGKKGGKDTSNKTPTLPIDRLHQISNKLLDRLSEKSTSIPRNTVFIIDGDRDAIYGRKPTVDRVELETFKQVAEARGYRVIDAHPVFTNYYQTTQKQVDFSPTDFHWNEAAYDTIAQTVYPSLTEIIKQPATPAVGKNEPPAAAMINAETLINPATPISIPPVAGDRSLPTTSPNRFTKLPATSDRLAPTKYRDRSNQKISRQPKCNMSNKK
jgi:hypothetical protein